MPRKGRNGTPCSFYLENVAAERLGFLLEYYNVSKGEWFNSVINNVYERVTKDPNINLIDRLDNDLLCKQRAGVKLIEAMLDSSEIRKCLGLDILDR